MPLKQLEHDTTVDAKDKREQMLIARYGDVLNLSDIAHVLRYPSTQAVRKAHLRRALPFQLVRIPRRRGWFATAKTVATALSGLDRVEGVSAPNEITGDTSMT